MIRKSILTGLAAALVLPAALAAQEAPAPRVRPAPRPGRAFTFSVNDNRGRIGVVVNTSADPATDRYGAQIEAVTPGGPAEKAGLKAGDIITKFNGTSLAGATSEDEGDSGPGRKLVSLARALDPGDTVRIEYRRGTETKPATLVAQDLGGFAWGGGSPMRVEPRVEIGDLGPLFERTEAHGFACFGDAWCDLDLVNINPSLGEYFGTREGILVVKAPDDSTLPLKGGDVILSIGTRKPTTPAHAMRILRSYDTGESVAIEIMRHERRQTLNWTVPDMSERNWRMMPRNRRDRGQPSKLMVPEPTQLKIRVVGV